MSEALRPDEQDIAALVREEARLVDEGHYDAWYALFAGDARYWVPLRPGQTDSAGEQSIACEDKLLLRIRIERLQGPKTYSHQPPVRCQHVLQPSRVETIDHGANRYVARTPFMYVEARQGGQLVLSGTATHRLRVEGGALRIVEKRVDLLNAGDPMPAIFLFP